MKRVFAVVLAFLCVAMLAGAPGGLSAANQNVGYVDFSFGSAPGTDPTADKPQSKLWFNDGLWWATMFHSGSGTWHIYKLNWPSQWVDTGTVIDTRATSRADALWDDGAKKLYIASLVRFDTSNQGQFSRYSYDSTSKTYTLDGGFPKVMMTGSAETLAMDKDSTGQFWITFTQSKRVYVNRTVDSSLNWGTPFIVPGPAAATTLNADDISSLVAYTDQDGSSIGVLWSNHNTPSTMYFTHHRDSDDDTAWPANVDSIYAATCAADDHINLKSLQSDASGAIYAAVKTSFGDAGCGGTSTSPLLRLVVRKPDNTWRVATFSTVGDDETRPQVLLDTTNRKVYMFATSPTSCGVIYMKSTSMDNPSFSAGKGTPFVSSSTYTCLNNVTSTKQTVNAASGLVVMASDESKLFYMHNTLDLGAPPSDTTPPIVTGKAPAANAQNVALNTSVTATFSEAVTGVSGTSFTLTPANGTAVAATVTYNSANKTATLTPGAALAANTTYTANLTPAIVDAANNPLAATSWSFTTVAAPPADTTPPIVTATVPAANATGVSTGASVTATFSEAVTGVSGSTFTLSGPGGAVAASVSYDSASKTATLTPGAALAFNTTYTANLTAGIADAANNPLAATSWSFTTAAAPPADTTPPTVTATVPAANATGVSTGASVTATFSEAVTGVSGSTFTLSGPGGPVAASVSYDSASKTATLAPGAALAANTTYTANLTAGIADAANNPLAATSWSFTTAAAPPAGSTVTFSPVADTYVSQAAPTSAYGTSTSFSIVDGATTAKQAFLRFTVSGLPAGATIASAKLRLYVTNDSTSGGIIKQVTDTSWPEALTWNTKPAIDGPTVATVGVAGVNATIEADLTSAITGNGTYSFAIVMPAGNSNTLGYASREFATVSQRPQLVITTN